MSVVSSIISMSPLNGFFNMIITLQLLLLLPLIPEYFPKNIMNLLTGVSFSMFTFDFIKFKDIPFIVGLTKWVSYPQSDEYLNDIGLNSDSSVINYLSIMATVVLICLVHILIVICYKCSQEKLLRTWTQKLIIKLFVYFTFNVYIRIFMHWILVCFDLNIFCILHSESIDRGH
ncbi:unnamed protein product [Moneuplotes crassus]|uniref:Uncharacterized protein n=1 Tax=Euplotes crassus TaxID=5936 RepID=A0AAD1XBZ7_EUPCR|nr:unnamed protein product [Moneuplotes crassus]